MNTTTKEWPFSEVDLNSSEGDNLSHMKFMLEGYRDRVIGDVHTPHGIGRKYSPGSARDESWSAGWDKADADLKKVVEVTPQIAAYLCSTCGTTGLGPHACPGRADNEHIEPAPYGTFTGEPDVYVHLTELGPSKLWVLKLVKDTTSLSLMESKALIENLPQCLTPEMVSPYEAGELMARYQEVGAKVEVSVKPKL